MNWDRAKPRKPDLYAPIGIRPAYLAHPRVKPKATTKEVLRQQAVAAVEAFGPGRTFPAQPSLSGATKIAVASDLDIVRVRELLAIHVGADIEVFTDGGCAPNPGPGGWGVVVLVNGVTAAALYGGSRRTTNNGMELTAAIVALRILPSARITIHSDSRYVIDGVTKWAAGWKRKGLLDDPAEGKLKNAGLWLKLITNADRLRPHWSWVRGHNGNAGNELADELAGAGRRMAGRP